MKLIAKHHRNQTSINKALRLGQRYIKAVELYDEAEVLSYTTETVSDRRLETLQNRAHDTYCNFIEQIEDYLPKYEQTRVTKFLNI